MVILQILAPYMSNFGVNQEQNKQKHYDYSINREAIRANLEKIKLMSMLNVMFIYMGQGFS
ncbi:MAG: hypothetical protein MZV70_69890 [Desulfobacterales bacterium]|nr:hypothetical protein [Desulfobacterales bacterium]